MDNLSVSSSLSSANQKLECPECKQDFQKRAMFGHLRAKHASFFLDLVKPLAPKEPGKPIKIVWPSRNDFDEEEWVVVFGCLASNKAFGSEDKALAHFQANPEALKEHNKQMKDMFFRARAVSQSQSRKPRGSPLVSLEARKEKLGRLVEMIREHGLADAEKKPHFIHWRNLPDAKRQHKALGFWEEGSPYENVEKAVAFFEAQRDTLSERDVWDLRFFLRDHVDFYCRSALEDPTPFMDFRVK